MVERGEATPERFRRKRTSLLQLLVKRRNKKKTILPPAKRQEGKPNRRMERNQTGRTIE